MERREREAGRRKVRARRRGAIGASAGRSGVEGEIARNESEAERTRESKRDRIGSQVKSTFIDRLPASVGWEGEGGVRPRK